LGDGVFNFGGGCYASDPAQQELTADLGSDPPFGQCWKMSTLIKAPAGLTSTMKATPKTLSGLSDRFMPNSVPSGLGNTKEHILDG
jgi:hypothetical protein